MFSILFFKLSLLYIQQVFYPDFKTHSNHYTRINDVNLTLHFQHIIVFVICQAPFTFVKIFKSTSYDDKMYMITKKSIFPFIFN